MLKNSEIIVKSEKELELMRQGGKKLAWIKNRLLRAVKEGVSATAVDQLADELVKDVGGKASFKMVPGYHWATCVNVNEGLVHGIPNPKVVFKKGDVVSVDVGLFYRGFHTDTSFTIGIETDEKIGKFLNTGRKALKLAISKATMGARIYDISFAIESVVKKEGYSPVRALVGHGVGKVLHEQPQIPCFTSGKRQDSPKIPEGAVLAIEVMYAMGSPEVILGSDGWTISASDGTITALFEDTVAVTKNGPLVLTVSDAVSTKLGSV